MRRGSRNWGYIKWSSIIHAADILGQLSSSGKEWGETTGMSRSSYPFPLHYTVSMQDKESNKIRAQPVVEWWPSIWGNSGNTHKKCQITTCFTSCRGMWHEDSGDWRPCGSQFSKHVPALYNFFVRKGEQSAVQHTLIMVTVYRVDIHCMCGHYASVRVVTVTIPVTTDHCWSHCSLWWQ